MSKNPTPEQALAINTIKSNVSLLAGAGSGKTYVLMKRFVQILRSDLSVNPTNIVAITFTRKAADEIKGRVRQAVSECVEQAQTDLERLRWQEHLQKVESAPISTIHSLCSRILRDNPVETQLDPEFTILEDFEAQDFFKETLQQYLRKNIKENAALRRLVQTYGVNSFVNQVTALGDKLSELVREDNLAEPYLKAKEELPALQQKLFAAVREVIEAREALGAKTKGRQTLTEAAGLLDEMQKQLLAPEPDCSLLDASGVVKVSGKALPAELTNLKNLRQELNHVLLNAKGCDLVQDWLAVLQEFYACLSARKQENNVLFNDDLDLLAIEHLQKNEALRQKYQERYKYIMVDEFQDTNERQRQLIYLLCGNKLDGKNNLFIVGDVKQSIYRFRHADVSVFNKVKEDIAQNAGQNLGMKTNFRSTQSIVESCNTAFCQLMNLPKEEICLEHHEGANTGGAKVCLMQVPYKSKDDELGAKEDKWQKEAEAIAAYLQQELPKVEPQLRPGASKAVLLRAMTHCEILRQTLQGYGINCVVVKGKGFYEQQEVLDILNLLAALHNRYASLELAGALRSNYFGLDDATLTQLFWQTENDKPLWDVLQAVGSGELQLNLQPEQQALAMHAAERLRSLRQAAALMALPELFAQLWDELKPEFVLSQQENGPSKLANVKKLRRLAQQYCQTKQASLAEWLQNVKDLRASSSKEPAATVQADDALQIMTIHNSKGLEFDLVILPQLDKSVKGDTASIKYLPGKEGEQGLLGIKVPDKEMQLQNSGVYELAKARDSELEEEESRRLLYVAMTRAQKQLLMVGTVAEEKLPEAVIGLPSAKGWWQQLQAVYEADWEKRESSCPWVRLLCADALSPAVEQQGEQQQLALEPLALAPLPAYAACGRTCFTASALQTYLHCQRQYYYQQVLAVPELEQTVAGEQAHELPASVTGSIVHKALELYNGYNAEAVFAVALEKFAPGAAATQAKSMFDAYIVSDLYKALPKKQKRELEFVQPLQQELAAEGVIDLLAFDEADNMIIVDYKTGTPPEPDEVKLGYAYQLALYRDAAEKLYPGKRVVRAELHFLQNMSVWQLPLDKSYLQEAVELCEEISGKGEEDDFACICNDSCAYCHYAYLCPQKNKE
ncbi:UvrD-helicase domain-containing protein [Phascolarctobacterium succinatutens]|uniref:UvrD-helicase domain-containing protein n=1 Tax=Phascolarctobacterium succinatutens TaxID=626940 RepID=UPI0026EDF8EA|nr:UvrD-helicase domain-containing protein [Phascolarctobacterium succinatutens]